MFEKTFADYAGLEEPYSDMAEDRVMAEPELLPYFDLLIERDWPHHDRHLKWVAIAPIKKIVAWATEIRADEADEAEPESFKYELVERRCVSMYPSQWAIVHALAHKKHQGKRSPALQEIVDEYDE